MLPVINYANCSFVEQPRMTWFKAKDHCDSEGGKLVEIDSKEENTALVEEIKREYNERKMHFWIGLTSRGKENDWRLASNGSKPSFENWHEGEPDNNHNKNCARLRIGPRPTWTNTWSDLDCRKESFQNKDLPEFSLHALCEFNTSKESSSTEETVTENPTPEETTTKDTPTTGILTTS